jgi:hypothetical protein
MRFITFLLLITSVTTLLTAQEKTTSSAQEEINNFKNGAAVVRLYMNKPKVDLLKKSIAGAVNNQEKRDLENMLSTHLSEREAYKSKVIEAFSKNFKFTKLYFINDYDIVRLKNGERSGLFLNYKGDLDPSITMDADHYLIFARGQNDNQIELIKPDNQPLPTSFPTKYNRNIGSMFKLIFQPKDKLTESVIKLNQGLKKYHSKMNEEGDS